MSLFTAPDTWTGGHIEVWMDFGSVAVLRTALNTLWDFPELDGPYASRDLDPAFQRRLPPERWQEPTYEELFGRFEEALSETFGVFRLADGARVPIAVTVWDDIIDDLAEVIVRIPLGGLARVREMGTFLEEGADTPDWLVPLSNELHGLAARLWNAAPFSEGLVGLDASMYRVDEILDDPEWQEHVGAMVTRNGRLLWQPPTGEPPTEGTPPPE